MFPLVSEVAHSCLTLCHPMDCSLPGSSIHGILQARILEWVAISFSKTGKGKVKVKSLSRVQFLVTPWTAAYQALQSMGFYRQEYWSGGAIAFSDLYDTELNKCVWQSSPDAATAAAAKSLQLCPTLWNSIDSSPPGSPVPGILQARTLEWVASSFSNAWKWKVKVKSLSHVWLLETLWTEVHQAPPSMGFSRQEYWSGMPLPSLDNLLTYQQFPNFLSLLGPPSSWDAAILKLTY